MVSKTFGQPNMRWFSPQLCPVIFCLSLLIVACNGNGGSGSEPAQNPVPVVSALSPDSGMAGGDAFTLAVTGSGFLSGSQVQWNGAARTTMFVSSTRVDAEIGAADCSTPGTAKVRVVNPAPGGGASNELGFVIQSPPPAVTVLNPAGAVAGGPAFDLTITGTGFIQGATVLWDGSARTTTFVSATQVSAAITAADIASPGTVPVSVQNPAPEGGTSNQLEFVIQPPPPVVTALIPAGVLAGSPGFDLTITGTGFMQGATVLWDGSARTTTFVSATQVNAAISAADIAGPGTVLVSVQNPAPYSADSNELGFLIGAAPPPAARVPIPITVAPDGSPPNGPSINGGMDLFGRYVIFASKASNLVPDDTNDAWDIFVRDTCIDMWGADVPGCTSSTRRISLAPDGSQANGDSGWTAASPDHGLAVSFDGRYVAFVSSASNLVADDTNAVDDVFMSSTCLGSVGTCAPQTVRVSLRANGSQSDSPAGEPAIGVGAGHVVFVSSDASMVPGDGNDVADVFLRDVCLNEPSGCTPGTRRISVGPGGGDTDGASGSPAFTGRYVAFTSAATNLVSGDTNGLVDVFLRDTCLGAPDGCTPSTERISVGEGGVEANDTSAEPCVGLPMSSMSGFDYHGRFIVFVSNASNLVAADTNGVADVFMRDTCRGRTGCVPSTKRVSLTSTGEQITGQPSMQPGHMRWDGEVVLFATAADGVVPEDTNGLADVYSRRVCHDVSSCAETTEWLSQGEGGLPGNGASYEPRGNHDAWVGPEYVTFSSEATNFLTGSVPTPYYGGIFRTTTY
jgi:hypothetical protein